MPSTDDKQTPGAKANGKSSRSTRGSHTESGKQKSNNQSMDLSIGESIEEKTGKLNIDPKSSDSDLLNKMSVIMKETIQESLSGFRKQVASEIASISLVNDENLTKLRKDFSAKLKSLETKNTKEYKSMNEKFLQSRNH